jgi:sugar phosphate isomerase/epimerase
MNRRSVLKGTAALAAASWAGVPVRAASNPPALGIQLYTLRQPLAKDFGGTLSAIRKIGYGEVETAGLLNQDPKSFRAALDAAGLSAPSGHIFPNSAQPLLYKMASGQLSPDEAWAQIEAPMTIDRLEDEVTDMIEQARVIGYRYLVLASMDPKLFVSMTGIKRVCDAFRRAGELCHQHGLKFAWHPHLQDWGMVEGKRAAEHVLDATDPNRVFVELDFFWAAMVNVDVPQFLRRYSGRVHQGLRQECGNPGRRLQGLLPDQGRVLRRRRLRTARFQDLDPARAQCRDASFLRGTGLLTGCAEERRPVL